MAAKSFILIPADSPLRARVAALLGAGADAAAGVPPGALVLADLTGRGAVEELKRLQPQLSEAGGVLAVLEPGGGELRDDLGIDAFITVEQLERELPWRMTQARARHLANREAAERQRDLALLLELTARYTESLDPVALLYDVTRRLAEAMEIIRASMVMVDEAHELGFVVAASDDPKLHDLRIELSGYPEIRETLRTGKPVIVEDAPSHPLLDGVHRKVAARGIRTIACLPMAVQGKVLGVLLVRASNRRRAFSMREIDFLATVAHATAVALRNAKLLETVRGQTEREKSARIAAEQRAESLKRYASYFASVSDGIAILDDQARVLILNPAGSELLDLGPEDARGQHIQAITQPTDEGVLMEVILHASQGQVRRDVDLRVKTLKGRKLTLSVSAAPLAEGNASAILSFRDVTTTRQMAEELRQTKEFLERLIDSSVDAILAADMKGDILLFNKGAEAISGYTAQEALAGLNVRNLYAPGVAEQVMARIRGEDHGGKGRLTLSRYDIITKKGEKVPVNMTAAILYEGEQEVATVGIFSDLRDRMQLERKLTDAESRAEESERNAVIVALAGTAAHELNQPLTSVMGYAEMLKRRLKEGDYAYRPVEIIYREAERMAEIVRKIGKITRFETMPYVGSSKILDLDKASSHED